MVSAISANSSTGSNLYTRFAADHRQTEFLVDNHACYRNTAEFKRIMFYQGDGTWKDYPDEILCIAKTIFPARTPAVVVTVSGRSKLLDFFRMVEVDFESGYQRSIAWLDVTGKFSSPKTPVIDSATDYKRGGGAEDDKADVNDEVSRDADTINNGEKTGYEGTSKRRRRLRARDIGWGNDEPWSKENAEAALRRWPGTTRLGEIEEEYKVAKKFFINGLRKGGEKAVTVTDIHCCLRSEEREAAYNRLIQAVKQKRGGSSANEVFAWYGCTAAGGVERFVNRRSLPDDLGRCANIGVGVYLTPHASSRFSAIFAEKDEGGEKHVIMCRVILGSPEMVTDRCQVFPSSREFDTGVDNLNDPKWYVVWPADIKTHILPEFVVSFRPHTLPEIHRGSSSSTISASTFAEYAMVVSKVGKAIPDSPARKLQNLFKLWRNGDFGEDLFRQQLTTYVSDEKLHEMLEEIRSG